MWNALARIDTILYGNVESRGVIYALYCPRHPLHRQEEILYLGGREVIEAGHNTTRRYQDMARKEGLEIHKRV
jgi:hypothetical protein